MLRARLMKYFIAIKFEVTGVNRAAAVSCQNESGSCWLKLIGPSQTMIWIETLDTCNKDKDIQPDNQSSDACFSATMIVAPSSILHVCHVIQAAVVWRPHKMVTMSPMSGMSTPRITLPPAHCSSPTTFKPAAGLDYGLTTGYTPIVVLWPILC